jgi:hypothetical protein
MRRINAKSQNILTNADLIARLRRTIDVTYEIDRRGGIVAVLESGQISEKHRRALVNALKRLRWVAAAYVVSIGDDRRAKGQATPLCRLPGQHEREKTS